MDNRWVVCDSDKDKVQSLQEQLNIHPTICQILVQRGIETYEQAKQFFRPSLDDLHDPFLMMGMDKAITRLHKAITEKEKILIYGDYDVDGTTSVALTYTFFNQFTDQLEYYIPDRYKEGYGISLEGIKWAKENDYSLILSLDCGITAVDEISYAKELGIDFIIGDHHLPGENLPPAFATLDPKQCDCCYPYTELSGAGIGFKICQAYAMRYDVDMEKVYDLLDYVVISIASDIVPITGENRTLAYFGLKKINENPRPGIKVIFDSLQLDKQVTVMDLVFIIGPRINAAGRMKHARLAVDMLIDGGTVGIDDKIKAINENNSARQDVDRSITEEALEMIRSNPKLRDRYSTVICKDDWHKGVIGIVASRLIESFYRPTVVLSKSNGLLSGSARSVKGFSVYDALDHCSDLLETFGGHKYAAGLSLKPENLEAFQNKFETYVTNTISKECMTPEIRIDAEISTTDITPPFFNILRQFAPFGPGNMHPVFMTKSLRDAGRSRLLKDKHIKFNVRNGTYGFVNGIGFNIGEKIDVVKKKNFDVCFSIDENHWNGRTELQMRVKDIRESKADQ